MRVGRAGVLHAAVRAKREKYKTSENTANNKKKSREIENNDFHAIH